MFLNEKLPEAADLEDFRPGTVVQRVHKGKPFGPEETVLSYPFTVTPNGTESVWVETEKTYPASADNEEFTVTGLTSLEDCGAVPYPEGGYNHVNHFRLIKLGPVEDETLPGELRKIVETPFAELTTEEKEQSTRYFLGQQATAFLERKARGDKDKLLRDAR